MGDGEHGNAPVKVELPTILGQKIEPWVNLMHTVGLPWVIIGVIIYYGVPFARDIADTSRKVHESQSETNKGISTTNQSIDKLHEQAAKAMPMLQEATEAIPILRAIQQQQLKERNREVGKISPQKIDDCE